MDNKINEIAQRIAFLREVEEISSEEMARVTGVSEDEYKEYEAGNRDFSFSFLFNVANRLSVDITELLTGENAKLKKFEYVKAGKGLKMERRKAYKYQHLASIFQNRHMEPFLVTVEPKDTDAVVKHSHNGHEFNFVIDGSMTMFIDNSEILMQPGDSIYFDAATPHAMRAEDGSACNFLAIISK